MNKLSLKLIKVGKSKVYGRKLSYKFYKIWVELETIGISESLALAQNTELTWHAQSLGHWESAKFCANKKIVHLSVYSF